MIWYIQVTTLTLGGVLLLLICVAQIYRYIQFKRYGRRVIAVVDAIESKEFGDGRAYVTTVKYTDIDGILRRKIVEDAQTKQQIGATMTVYAKEDDPDYVLTGHPAHAVITLIVAWILGSGLIYAALTW